MGVILKAFCHAAGAAPVSAKISTVNQDSLDAMDDQIS